MTVDGVDVGNVFGVEFGGVVAPGVVLGVVVAVSGVTVFEMGGVGGINSGGTLGVKLIVVGGVPD